VIPDRLLAQGEPLGNVGVPHVESLLTATGRVFTPAEREESERGQVTGYRWTFLLSGITHPNFDRSRRGLSVDGHRRVGELARAIG